MNNKYSIVWNKSLRYSLKADFNNKKDSVYQAVETLLYKLELDQDNYKNKNIWNPFKNIIKPGNNVVLKVNFVTPRDKESQLSLEQLLTVCTNPEVINPIIDYVWKALAGNGSITIVDSPVEATNLEEIYKEKLGINIKLIDLRDFIYVRKMLIDDFHFLNHSINLGFLIKKDVLGDPDGYQKINLKTSSYFNDKTINHRLLCFHRSDTSTAAKYHTREKNLYSISQTVLNSDVFINIPKLKTHKKSGVTLSLKNLVGITNRKHWLPHYRSGLPPAGDELPKTLPIKEKIRQMMSRIPLPNKNSIIINIINLKNQKHYLSEGCWFGNDTIWRTILDFNKILLFCDKKGKLHQNQQRKYISIIDGIISGEGNGPMRPDPVNHGFLIAGFNPGLVDILATTSMGFDYYQNKQLLNSLKLFQLKKSFVKNVVNKFINTHPNIYKFKAATGWDEKTRKLYGR
jgi:uncharacterized protein (DUF362 family)